MSNTVKVNNSAATSFRIADISDPKNDGGSSLLPPPFFSTIAVVESGTAAFLSHSIVVAAFLRFPVADEVFRTRQLFRPCIAGDEAGGLPHHVELAIATHFADEHRLGDVM